VLVFGCRISGRGRPSSILVLRKLGVHVRMSGDASERQLVIGVHRRPADVNDEGEATRRPMEPKLNRSVPNLKSPTRPRA
jgi:hypothetical protein